MPRNISKLIFGIILLFPFIIKAQLSGFYTIDPSMKASISNYKDFKSAIEDLNFGTRSDGGVSNGKGIKSVVEFNVKKGKYSNPLEILPINGASSINTITFKNLGKVNDVIINDTFSKTSYNYVLRLNGADFIHFENVSIRFNDNFNTGSTVVFMNNADSNQIRNCEIYGPKNQVNSIPVNAAIASTDGFYSNDSNNIIEGNSIKYGYYGIYFTNDNINYETGNQIINNRIDSSFGGGIYVGGQFNPLIKNNLINNVQNNSGLGLYAFSLGGKIEISSNAIYLNNGGIGALMYYVIGNNIDTAMFCNNFISIQKSGNSGIYSYGGDKIKFVYNSMLLEGNASISFGAYISGASAFGSFHYFKNNIVQNNQKGGSFYLYTLNNSLFESDNNVFYGNKNGRFLLNSSTYLGLSDWQTKTAFDDYSKYLNPKFSSYRDLRITNPLLNGLAEFDPKISSDYFGNSRTRVSPDPGAHEIVPVGNDAGITSIDSPHVACAGKSKIYVALKNYGLKTLTSTTIQWEVDTGNTTTSTNQYIFKGNIKAGDDSSIFLGSIIVPYSKNSFRFKAYSSLPNGIVDSIPENDSIYYEVNKGLNGKYSIGRLSSDYQNLTIALNDLEKVGVCGKTSFLLEDGIYQGRYDLPIIKGGSTDNYVEISSKSRDSSKVVLNNPSGISYEPDINYLIQMQGLSYYNINHLTLKRSGTGNYGDIFKIGENCSNYSISNNRLETVILSTSNTNIYNSIIGINESGSFNFNNKISDNLFLGGFKAINLGGTQNLDTTKNNQISNNQFDSVFSCAINISNNNGVKILNNNINTLLSNGLGIGINISKSTGKVEISKNKINLFIGGEGIKTDAGSKGNKKGKFLISNNQIYIKGSGAGSNIGLNSLSLDTGMIAHNSIWMDINSFNATTMILGGNSNIIVENNIFQSLGKNFGFIIRSNVPKLNFNNYYFPKSKYFAKMISTSYSNINAWKSGTGKDGSSKILNPWFQSDLDLTPKNPLINDIISRIPNVLDDINNVQRKALTDYGAVEINPFNNDIGIVSIDSPNAGFCSGTKNIYVKLRNYGLNTISSATINWTLNKSKMSDVVSTVSIPKGGEISVKLGTFAFTSSKVDSLFAKTSNPNNGLDSMPLNDSFSIALKPGLSGGYIVGGSIGSDYPTPIEAINDLNQFGICGNTTFQIRDSIYYGSCAINKIQGANPAKLVTFTSFSGDSNGVIWSLGSSNNDKDNFILNFKGTENVAFSKINFQRTGNFPVSNIIEFGSNCKNLSFSSCSFKGVGFTTNNAYKFKDYSRIIHSIGGENKNIKFINNHFYGNYSCFNIFGNSSSSRDSNIVISENTIENSFSIGTLYNQDVIIIERNKFINIYGYESGLVFNELYNAPQINGNYFEMSSINAGPAMNANAMFGNSKKLATISNNIISTKGINTYGVSFTNCDSLGFYFNTISNFAINTYYPVVYLYNVQSVPPKSIFLNNIISSFNTGDLMYVSNFFAKSDNNLFFTKGNIGSYDNTSCSNLSDWKTASGKDSKSLFADPKFISTTNLHCSNFSPSNSSGVTILGTSKDIDGELRDYSKPDIGADEFSPLSHDVSIDGIYQIYNATCSDSNSIIEIGLSNYGNNKEQNIPINLELRFNGSLIKKSLVFPDTILPNTSKKILFKYFNLYRGGEVSILSYCALYNDLNRKNDTFKVNLELAKHSSLPNDLVIYDCKAGRSFIQSPKIKNEQSYWYDSAQRLIFQGDTFPFSVKKKTSIYLQKDGFKAIGGLKSINYTNVFRPSSDFSNGLIFDALYDFIIDSITIYPQTSGNLKLNIYDSNATIFAIKTITVNPKYSYQPITIPIKLLIKKGKGYIINAEGSSCGALLKSQSSYSGNKIVFPYKIDSFMIIFDNTNYDGKDYNFFYQFQLKNQLVCASDYKKIEIFPVGKQSIKPDFSFKEQCAGANSEFYGKTLPISGIKVSKYQYQFGDSSLDFISLKTDSTKHIYSKDGTYKASLFATSSDYCTDSISKTLNIISGAVANFNVQNIGCEGQNIKITDLSKASTSISQFQYYFGDGDSSLKANNFHKFNASGRFTIKLNILTSSGCTSSKQAEIEIQPKPVIKSLMDDLCQPLMPIKFTDSSKVAIGNIKSIYWNLNNGAKIDTSPSFTYKFKGFGKFPLVHVVKGSNGCSDTIKSDVLLLKSIESRFSSSVSNAAVTLFANDASHKYYFWDFGDTTSKGSDSSFTTHKYSKIGLQKVKLTVTAQNGCISSSDSTIVIFTFQEINNIPKVKVSIYPNPVNLGFIHIKIEDFPNIIGKETVQLQILDMNGNQISGEKVKANVVSTIPFLFPKGIYFVKINIGKETFVKKVIIE